MACWRGAVLALFLLAVLVIAQEEHQPQRPRNLLSRPFLLRPRPRPLQRPVNPSPNGSNTPGHSRYLNNLLRSRLDRFRALKDRRRGREGRAGNGELRSRGKYEEVEKIEDFEVGWRRDEYEQEVENHQDYDEVRQENYEDSGSQEIQVEYARQYEDKGEYGDTKQTNNQHQQALNQHNLNEQYENKEYHVQIQAEPALYTDELQTVAQVNTHGHHGSTDNLQDQSDRTEQDRSLSIQRDNYREQSDLYQGNIQGESQPEENSDTDILGNSHSHIQTIPENVQSNEEYQTAKVEFQPQRDIQPVRDGPRRLARPLEGGQRLPNGQRRRGFRLQRPNRIPNTRSNFQLRQHMLHLRAQQAGQRQNLNVQNVPPREVQQQQYPQDVNVQNAQDDFTVQNQIFDEPNVNNSFEYLGINSPNINPVPTEDTSFPQSINQLKQDNTHLLQNEVTSAEILHPFNLQNDNTNSQFNHYNNSHNENMSQIRQNSQSNNGNLPINHNMQNLRRQQILNTYRLLNYRDQAMNNEQQNIDNQDRFQNQNQFLRAQMPTLNTQEQETSHQPQFTNNQQHSSLKPSTINPTTQQQPSQHNFNNQQPWDISKIDTMDVGVQQTQNFGPAVDYDEEKRDMFDNRGNVYVNQSIDENKSKFITNNENNYQYDIGNRQYIENNRNNSKSTWESKLQNEDKFDFQFNENNSVRNQENSDNIGNMAHESYISSQGSFDTLRHNNVNSGQNVDRVQKNMGIFNNDSNTLQSHAQTKGKPQLSNMNVPESPRQRTSQIPSFVQPANQSGRSEFQHLNNNVRTNNDGQRYQQNIRQEHPDIFEDNPQEFNGHAVEILPHNFQNTQSNFMAEQDKNYQWEGNVNHIEQNTNFISNKLTQDNGNLRKSNNNVNDINASSSQFSNLPIENRKLNNQQNLNQSHGASRQSRNFALNPQPLQTNERQDSNIQLSNQEQRHRSSRFRNLKQTNAHGHAGFSYLRRPWDNNHHHTLNPTMLVNRQSINPTQERIEGLSHTSDSSYNREQTMDAINQHNFNSHGSQISTLKETNAQANSNIQLSSNTNTQSSIQAKQTPKRFLNHNTVLSQAQNLGAHAQSSKAQGNQQTFMLQNPLANLQTNTQSHKRLQSQEQTFMDINTQHSVQLSNRFLSNSRNQQHATQESTNTEQSFTSNSHQRFALNTHERLRSSPDNKPEEGANLQNRLSRPSNTSPYLPRPSNQLPNPSNPEIYHLNSQNNPNPRPNAPFNAHNPSSSLSNFNIPNHQEQNSSNQNNFNTINNYLSNPLNIPSNPSNIPSNPSNFPSNPSNIPSNPSNFLSNRSNPSRGSRKFLDTIGLSKGDQRRTLYKLVAMIRGQDTTFDDHHTLNDHQQHDHLSRIPDTGFECHGRAPGYHADTHPASACHAFHLCAPDGSRTSYLCPPGTTFNQRLHVCDHQDRVTCTQHP